MYNWVYLTVVSHVYHQRLLTDQEAIRNELARIKAEKLARRMLREKETLDQVPPPAQPSRGWIQSWW